MGRLTAHAVRSSSLAASSAFALSGGAFAIGNLLLARKMPTTEYGHFSLGVAIFIIFSQFATFGINQLVLRRRIDPGPRLLARLVAQGVLTAITVVFAADLVYNFRRVELVLIALAIMTGNLLWVATSGFQSSNRRLAALGAQTAPDWLILTIGTLAVLVTPATAIWPLALYCIVIALIGPSAWLALARQHRVPMESREPISLRALGPLFGIAAGGVVLVQFERVIIPPLIGIDALAMFNVLASVAIFPFRLVTAGAGFALVPRLRAVPEIHARRQLVRQELGIIALALTAVTVFVGAVSPYAASWLTAGRYEPSLLLVLAACLNGAAKVAQVVPRAIITACGSERDVTVLNRCVWASIGASAVGALLAAPAGLAGVLTGMALGNLAGAAPAAQLARRALLGDSAPPRPA